MKSELNKPKKETQMSKKRAKRPKKNNKRTFSAQSLRTVQVLATVKKESLLSKVLKLLRLK